jgi:hypothetical protein
VQKYGAFSFPAVGNYPLLLPNIGYNLYFCFNPPLLLAMKETTQAFYHEVQQEFNRIAEQREFGVLKYTKEYCLARVAKKVHRSPATIENIVFNRV